MAVIKDLTGQKFGRLIVIRPVKTDKRREYSWECQCDCGNLITVRGSHLKRGETCSCGCLRVDRNIRHGMTNSPEYRAWKNMIKRCEYDKDSETYKHYGGRGIKVCERWRNSFICFLKDMGMRPSKNHSIDRLDVNGDYDPKNCTWSTKSRQAFNKRDFGKNKTGVKGVYLDTRNNKYYTQIGVNGRCVFLGLFESIDDAKKARKRAEIDLWGGDAE